MPRHRMIEGLKDGNFALATGIFCDKINKILCAVSSGRMRGKYGDFGSYRNRNDFSYNKGIL